jgi:hypothetical protein
MPPKNNWMYEVNDGLYVDEQGRLRTEFVESAILLGLVLKEGKLLWIIKSIKLEDHK